MFALVDAAKIEDARDEVCIRDRLVGYEKLLEFVMAHAQIREAMILAQLGDQLGSDETVMCHADSVLVIPRDPMCLMDHRDLRMRVDHPFQECSPGPWTSNDKQIRIVGMRLHHLTRL